MLANASIVRTHWLQPPGFGFEGTMRVPFPRSDRPRVGTHFQHVLHIEGSVPHEFADYHLRVDVHVRGALWRSQTHTLCTSLDPNPEHETRHCEAGSGTFAAHVWAFVPASRPWSPLGSGAVGVSSSNSLAAAATPAAATPALVPAGVSTAARGAGTRTGRLLRLALGAVASINVCKLSHGPPLPNRLVGEVCNTSAARALNMSHNSPQALVAAGAAGLRQGVTGRVTPDALMQSHAWRMQGKSDMFGGDWRALGAMFALAALTLPQPFTIVESGNFCGGTTGFFALLRRELCPGCPYLSLDPGGYRRKRHAKFTCHREALSFAGLLDHVTFVDDPSPVAVVEQPVGFVYMDGGKCVSREANSGPQHLAAPC